MFPDNEEEMIMLAYFAQDGKLKLNSQGLKVISDFVEGQIQLITLQGFHHKKYKIDQAFTKSKIRSNGSQNKLWIRPKPILDQSTNKYLIFLQTSSLNDEECKEYCHVLVSLISLMIIVAVEDDDDLYYFNSVAQRVSCGSDAILKYFDNKTKGKISHILCLMPQKSQSSNREYFSNTIEALYKKLDDKGIQNQVIASYPQIKCYSCPKDDLQYSSQALQMNLYQEVQLFFTAERTNSQLMYGPILVQYLTNIVNQLNQYGKVNIEKAEDEIQIEEAYEAYVSSIDAYHQLCLQTFNQYERPDEPELKEALNVARKLAHEQFFKKGGSSNMRYKKLLDDYINHKEIEVKNAYTRNQKQKNLLILENESQIILKRIKKEKRQEDTEFIKDQIDTMKRNYEHQARGAEKYQLYNEYMKVFTPIAYGFQDKYNLLKTNKDKNRRLQEKIASMKKRKGGCCAGSNCSIM